MPGRLLVPHEIYQAITAHARSALPNEACGLLRGNNGAIIDILPARNVADHPESDFQVDAQSLLRALQWEDAGDDLIAIYHSHPASPAYPSAVDAMNAFYPDSVSLILSLQQPQAPELRGFYLRAEAVFRDATALSLRQNRRFQQVRPGLWGLHLPANASLPGIKQKLAPARSSFYLVFEESSGRRPAFVRLISVLPVAVSVLI